MRVQIVVSRGNSVSPAMRSSVEDLPADSEPTTMIDGSATWPRACVSDPRFTTRTAHFALLQALAAEDAGLEAAGGDPVDLGIDD